MVDGVFTVPGFPRAPSSARPTYSKREQRRSRYLVETTGRGAQGRAGSAPHFCGAVAASRVLGQSQPEGLRKPAPKPSAAFPGLKGVPTSPATVPEPAGATGTSMGLGNTLDVLGCPFVNSGQPLRWGHACSLPRPSAPTGRGRRARLAPGWRLGGHQKPRQNATARIRRRTGSLGFFLQILISFLPRVRPELDADARCYCLSFFQAWKYIG